MQNQEKNAANQKAYLENLLGMFEKKQLELNEKILRQQDLLSRQASKKWPERKKVKFERRLSESKREFSQVLDLINQVQLQLKTLGID